MKITIYNAVNPLASKINVFGDERLAEFAREHAPERDQTVQIISRRDASDLAEDPMLFGSIEKRAFTDRFEYIRRGYVEQLLKSYSPELVCETLFSRGVPRDWDGIVMLDHETQAWKSALHRAVYYRLYAGVSAVFEDARVYEYAGVDTQRIGPSEEHDWRFDVRRPWADVPLSMPCMYIPESWLKLTNEQVGQWTRHAIRHAIAVGDIPVLSPFIDGGSGSDYSVGQLVPVPLMTGVIRTLAEMGFTTLAVWGAHANAEQADRTCQAIADVIVPAVDNVEKNT